jgi:type III secretory pathway component EscV
MSASASVERWFVIDFIGNVAAALVLLLLPEKVLPLLGWTAVDSIMPRLLGAALMGGGVYSFLNRDEFGEEVYQRLGVKLVSLATAGLGLGLGLGHGAPAVVYALLAAVLAAFLFWSVLAFRLWLEDREDAKRSEARAAESIAAAKTPTTGAGLSVRDHR